jgi:hypothetical protein
MYAGLKFGVPRAAAAWCVFAPTRVRADSAAPTAAATFAPAADPAGRRCRGGCPPPWSPPRPAPTPPAPITLVPLNRMCSRKCAVPLFASVSNRLPELIQIPTVAVSACGLASVATRKPLSSVVICGGSAGDRVAVMAQRGTAGQRWCRVLRRQRSVGYRGAGPWACCPGTHSR